MKIKTTQETVKELIRLLEQYDSDTEKFLDNLPTPEKYAILAMYKVVTCGHDDYELVHDDTMHSVSAQDLTNHLMRIPFLNYALEDALRLKWEYFECVWADEDPEEKE